MPASSTEIERSLHRIERLEQAILDQRAFLYRVPDPDTRYRAEGNLMKLIEMRDDLRIAHMKMVRG